jgi:hypothetical protein
MVLGVRSLEGGVEVERRAAAQVPVQVQATLASGETRRVTWQPGHSSALLFAGEDVVSATVDPRGEVLLDPNRLDNGLTRRSGPAAARSLSLGGLLLLVAQALGSLVMP